MKKLLLGLLLLTSLSMASSKMYIGTGDHTGFIAGVEVSTKLADFQVEYQIETSGIEWNEEVTSFTPKYLVYVFKLKYKDIYYQHTCNHGIDAGNKNRIIENIVGITLEMPFEFQR